MGTEFRDFDPNHINIPAERISRAELDLIRYLRRSKDQFAAIFHGVAEGIMVRNVAGALVHVNDAASKVLGYPSYKDLLDSPTQEAGLDRVQVLDEAGQSFPPEQLPWRLALQGAEEASAVLRFRLSQTGEERVALVRSAPIFDENGQVQLEVTTITDITQRKKAEEEAEGRRRLLEALFETSPVGIFMGDTSERVLYVNTELNRICGRPADSAGDMDDYWKGVAFCHRDGSPYDSDELPLRRALRGQERVRAQEIYLHCEDGRVVPTLANATPICTSDGQVAGGILVLQDISALEEATKFRTEFLGMVGHELKNPLSNIKLSAFLGLNSPDAVRSTEGLEIFRIIHEETNRMQGIIDELLDINRIEAGIIPLTQESHSLGEIVEEARQVFSRRGKSNPLVINLPEALPRVSVDRTRILQVLENLLDNAAKYSPEATPIALQVEAGVAYLTVHIEDQGLGIPPEKLPLLFNKFTRLHETSAKAAPGIGLGLAICKGIVEAHGGRIWASSHGEGQGTTFSLTLPTHADLPVAVVLSPAPTLPDLDESYSARPSTVLVVDDEEHTTAIIRLLLAQAGYRPVATTDPVQVARLVESESPELVLLDLRLPGTSGFEVFREIRQHSVVPILFLTASDSRQDIERARELGAADYITKPCSPAELLARIETVLERPLA